MMTRTKRMAALLAILAVLPMASGCFGSFGLTRKVYKFNTDINNDKWMREGVFLLLSFPFFSIYGLAGFCDVLFFNSVEFWTGESMITADEGTPSNRAHPNDSMGSSGQGSSGPAMVPPSKSNKPAPKKQNRR